MKVLPCDVQHNWMFVNNKCLKYFTDGSSWPDANASCRARNGSLAVFQTAQELNNVESSVLPPTYTVWIGLTDLKASRVWKWVDGTQLTFDVWRTGEPSSVDENCVLMINGEFWNIQWNHNFNDGKCVDHFDFLCEKSPRVPPKP